VSAARPLRFGNESEQRAARDALEERLVALDDLEVQLAEMERALTLAGVRWAELAGDIRRAGATLLSTDADLAEADAAVHALGVRVHTLASLMEHPARRLRVLHHLAGVGAADGASAPGSALRALVSARWTAATSLAGTQVGLEALADGFPDGAPARIHVVSRGTEKVAASMAAEVQGGRIAALWTPAVPDEYEFVIDVQGALVRSGPMRVVDKLRVGGS
jgi:hypothetical protein